MTEPSTLFVKVQMLEENVQRLSNSIDDLENRLMNKLDEISDRLVQMETNKNKTDFMVDHMWKKCGFKDQETFTQGTNRLISTAAIWISGIVISTVLVTLLQNWLRG